MVRAVTERTPTHSEVSVAVDLLYEEGDSDKREYLEYRYSGFTRAEAAQLCGFSVGRVNDWADEDERFKVADRQLTLQKEERRELRREVLQHLFGRNMKMVLEHDRRILSKATEDWDNLTRDEIYYLVNIRKYYTASELTQMEKLLDGGDAFNLVQLIHQVNNYHQEGS